MRTFASLLAPFFLCIAAVLSCLGPAESASPVNSASGFLMLNNAKINPSYVDVDLVNPAEPEKIRRYLPPFVPLTSR